MGLAVGARPWTAGRGLWRKAVRRIGQAAITLFGGAVITFLLLSATPGDPAERILLTKGQESATPEAVAALRESMGLNEPFLLRLWQYLTGLLRADLGTSWSTGRPVSEELVSRLGATLTLAIAALIVAVMVSLVLGLVAAWAADRWPDHLARTLSMVFLVVPSFMVGIVVLDLVVVRAGWGTVISDGTWKTVLLPALTLGLASAASWSRVLRTSLLEAGSQTFLLVSRARGASSGRRMLVHQLPNALPPYVTIAGMEVAVLIGGAPIVEGIYSWPGIGRFTIQAVESRDMPVVVGYALLSIALFVVASLIADAINSLLDPRIREHA